MKCNVPKDVYGKKFTVTASQLKELVKKEACEEYEKAFQLGFKLRGKVDSLALNRIPFRFGKDRLKQFYSNTDDVIKDYNGYSRLHEGIADEKLDAALRQIGVDTDCQTSET